MISNISVWTQGIVIAVIIGTLLQMILPDNKNKKYIKVVIGVYVLFAIIHPVVGKSLNVDNYKLENYLKIEETNVSKKTNNNDNVSKLFKENISKTIKKLLNDEGYDSNNIKIAHDENYNIISIDISNIFEYKEKSSIVNKVEISIKDKPSKGIAISDKESIIKKLSETYKVKIDSIKIE